MSRAKTLTAVKTDEAPPRRECEVLGRGAREPNGLFGGLWREGEMALLFGVAGAGKSILAVQIADALARGSGIAGVEMPGRRMYQTSSQAGKVCERPVTGTLTCFESGLVGFEFQEPLGHLSDEMMMLIGKAYEMHDAGLGVRKIGRELGVSRSTAARLLKKRPPQVAALIRRRMPPKAAPPVRTVDEWVEREASARYGFDTRLGASQEDDHEPADDWLENAAEPTA
ncbi:MAG: AAA family ATPase, partial [Acidobacteriota bacterium]